MLLATTVAAALTPTEWSHRQALNVAAPGLAKFAVPAGTFDGAQPDLSDLRLVDATGHEVSYLLDYHPSFRPDQLPMVLRPQSFRSRPDQAITQLIIETGTANSLEAVDLQSPVPFFLKAAHVEISPDGQEWESLGPALPVFRQFGAEQLRLPLNHRSTAFVRITLDDRHSRPVEFVGARILSAPARANPPALSSLGARISRRDEFAGETVLTVALDARHVPLAELSLEVSDPLFMRLVIVTVREVRKDSELNESPLGEHSVARGVVYRVALDGAPVKSQFSLAVAFTPTTRELLVHIHNGDSPPLNIGGLQAKQHPVNLLFMAPAAGTYTLLSGNPQAAAPRYDLAAFAGEMRTASATLVVPGDLEAMPDYHPGESLGPPLPEVPLTGAPLDARDWPYRKAVQIAREGVQELELDLEVLAKARPDFADLRLLRDGNQIPYVLEQTGLARSLPLTPVASPDAKRPGVSLWQLHLPQAGPPLRRLRLSSATPLFERQFRIFEKLKAPDGSARENTLASGPWSRTPEPGASETKVFELPYRARTDIVWIETDNGDNPAIALGAVQAVYPVVRLVFKVAESHGFTLAYGNNAAVAPRYDLSLVAVRLLTSNRNVAQISAGEQNPGSTRNFFAGLDGGYAFWGALGLVVIVLLVVVAKLLPKPPAA